MLIVYDRTTGDVLDNTGTSSALPEGPPDEDAYVNTDARGIARDRVALLRLHDEADAELVDQLLTHEHRVDVEAAEPTVVVEQPRPAPPPPPPPRDWPAELRAASTVEQLRNLLAEHPAFAPPPADDRRRP